MVGTKSALIKGVVVDPAYARITINGDDYKQFALADVFSQSALQALLAKKLALQRTPDKWVVITKITPNRKALEASGGLYPVHSVSVDSEHAQVCLVTTGSEIVKFNYRDFAKIPGVLDYVPQALWLVYGKEGYEWKLAEKPERVVDLCWLGLGLWVLVPETLGFKKD